MGNLSESPNSDLGISIASPLCHLFSSLFSSLCFLSPLWNGKTEKKKRKTPCFFSQMLRFELFREKKCSFQRYRSRFVTRFPFTTIEYLWVDRSLRLSLEENLLNLRRVKWKNSLEFFVIYLILLSLDFYNYSMYMF